MNFTRKDFIRLSVVSIGAAACGGGASGVPDGGIFNQTDAGVRDAGTIADAGSGSATCSTAGAINGSISGNHGHSLVVPAADFATTNSKTYDIQGDASHGHTITLTAENLASLLAGSKVAVTSSSDSGHTHGVQVVCA